MKLALDGDVATRARSLVESGQNELYLSAASSWEIAIKHALGKLRLPEPPARYVPSRLDKLRVLPLAIDHRHALHVTALPAHHRDPFDRLIVAQAQLEDLPVLTADPQLDLYDITVLPA
jgi:PIN domain nuclease of toxin-antitoxin system